jgi:hypothetical protein
MNNIFVYRNNTDGNVGIGKLPNYFTEFLNNIENEYIFHIPDKTKTTYHTYYTDLIGDLKLNFDKIQYDTFWNNICYNIQNCIIQNVFEMNEIYYSNPKPNFESTNLYGAAANLIPHRDCILYNFNGIAFYRVILGITGNNNDTITEFINYNLETKINKGDFMIFDFDKTLHRVKKIGKTEVPRILMKLHFIVCENCKYDINYVKTIAYFYKYYYYIARYTEQIGTDPNTFLGFFFGLLWEYPFYHSFKYIVFILFVSNIIILNRFYKIKLTNYVKLISYSLFILFSIYCKIVLFYYVCYILHNRSFTKLT